MVVRSVDLTAVRHFSVIDWAAYDATLVALADLAREVRADLRAEQIEHLARIACSAGTDLREGGGDRFPQLLLALAPMTTETAA